MIHLLPMSRNEAGYLQQQVPASVSSAVFRFSGTDQMSLALITAIGTKKENGRDQGFPPGIEHAPFVQERPEPQSPVVLHADPGPLPPVDPGPGEVTCPGLCCG